MLVQVEILEMWPIHIYQYTLSRQKKKTYITSCIESCMLN